MKITITVNEQEIKNLLKDYVSSQGISIDSKEVSVTMIAGRGSNGHSASISITDTKQSNTPATPEPEEELSPMDAALAEDVDDDDEVDFGS